MSSILTPPHPSIYIPGSIVNTIFSDMIFVDLGPTPGNSCTSKPTP